MYRCKISKRDDELTLTLPDDLVSRLDLKEGQTLSASVIDGTLILRQGDTPFYTLDELLAATDPDALTQANTDSEWLETSPRVGREII
ncbi:antitoxin ChpS [Thalassospira xiamenensis]|uniref:Antitoxin ChpS n=2 Tax=Thalassospira xiamenensis TaxID=220697 RepID=A0A285TDU5_9PROT|nr:antitoxin ChpS [Thalassospira xiamenensis]